MGTPPTFRGPLPSDDEGARDKCGNRGQPEGRGQNLVRIAQRLALAESLARGVRVVKSAHGFDNTFAGLARLPKGKSADLTKQRFVCQIRGPVRRGREIPPRPTKTMGAIPAMLCTI